MDFERKKQIWTNPTSVYGSKDPEELELALMRDIKILKGHSSEFPTKLLKKVVASIPSLIRDIDNPSDSLVKIAMSGINFHPYHTSNLPLEQLKRCYQSTFWSIAIMRRASEVTNETLKEIKKFPQMIDIYRGNEAAEMVAARSGSVFDFLKTKKARLENLKRFPFTVYYVYNSYLGDLFDEVLKILHPALFRFVVQTYWRNEEDKKILEKIIRMEPLFIYDIDEPSDNLINLYEKLTKCEYEKELRKQMKTFFRNRRSFSF